MPWLEQGVARLAQAAAAGRLPSALLVHESPGAGGMQLALRFAQAALCGATPPGCGTCADCTRVRNAEHPDLRIVPPDPELKSGQISVDQIREMSAWLALTSHGGRGSCVVITPADAMTRAACNALLKTLEEPRAGARLVLVTTQPARLPATIRSRCQLLRAPAPTRAAALAWLQAERPGEDWEAALEVLGVAPLEARESDPGMLRRLRDQARDLLRDARAGRLDIVRLADQWSRDELPLRLRALEQMLAAEVLANAGGAAPSRPDRPLPDAAAPQKIAAALRLLDEVRELQLQLATPINRTLAFERQLWRFSAAAN